MHGHTHQPHAHREGGTVFVTPGPVGRAEDGDPRAAYALLDLGGRRASWTVRRVAYDTAHVVAELARRGLPREFGIMAEQGISLARARRLLARPGR